MEHFNRRKGALYAQNYPCSELAEEFGTPLFVYSRDALEQGWLEFSDALEKQPHLICYAVKANSNLAVLDVLARLGSGFDIVSGGELKRVLAAGADPEKIVFSGVGKTVSELTEALEIGIRCFNVESEAELDRLANIAKALDVVAPVSLRVNPDVDAQTHPYISTGLKENKFGINMLDAVSVYKRAADMPSIDIQGMDCHIGSQLTSIEPYKDAMERLITLVDELSDAGIHLKHLDVGGGQGISYEDESALDIKEWAACVIDAIGQRDLEILVEPGRYIAGPAGILLTRVEYLKSNEDKHFAVVDAAMNDLIRPALYSAWQSIEAVEPGNAVEKQYDVVGPICESSDFLGKDRSLAIEQGDLLAVMSAGAYGFVMSSNYNTRPRAAEVMVSGDDAYVVRERENVEDLFADESLLP